jgi:hypothetical protein
LFNGYEIQSFSLERSKTFWTWLGVIVTTMGMYLRPLNCKL